MVDFPALIHALIRYISIFCADDIEKDSLVDEFKRDFKAMKAKAKK